jgi:hypothetical protein
MPCLQKRAFGQDTGSASIEMQRPTVEILYMNAMHSTKIIYPSLCEKRIVFRLTVLLSEILFLSLFEPQQLPLGLILLLQIGLIPSKSGTMPLKPYMVQREKTEKGD